MILTGKGIIHALEKQDILIKNFNPDNINPNSYDVCLGNILKFYDFSSNWHLDPFKSNKMYEIDLNKQENYILSPDKLYLAHTIESTISKKYVPVLYGKSSLARLGIAIHITAGFGDIGWGYQPTKDNKAYKEGEFYIDSEENCFEITYPTWTLEITVMHPVLVKAGMKIGQVAFFNSFGEINFYNGKYHKQDIAQESKYHENY